MVPNGSAYSNFPPFATNGTKTPPGGSPESAKYALGMVPADTFPAEWANYLFHGATAGITRLNADTGSIKKEINSVLDNFNITPDGTLTDQLMTALNKLKAEAALAAHPVGSLYWTSSSENPAVTFGGGTWVQIKDRFVYAKGDSDTVNSTGGDKTVTLSVANMPEHYHTVTIGSTSGSFSGNTGDAGAHSGTVGFAFETGYWPGAIVGYADGVFSRNNNTSGGKPLHIPSYYKSSPGENCAFTLSVSDHKHSISGSISVDFGTKDTDKKGSGTEVNKMPPYICKYCWERVS